MRDAGAASVLGVKEQRSRAPASASRGGLEPGTAEGGRRAVGIYMVGILPGNLDRSLAFYEALGVELRQDGDRLHFASRQRDAVVFFVNGTGAVVPATDAPRVALEFRLPEAALVDQAYGDAVQAGGEPYRPPELAPFGDYLALVLDPDGNVVALSAPGRSTGDARDPTRSPGAPGE